MLLTVDKLWVYYGQVQALRDVSVYADEGEIVSVIGLNGAGKSTLLKTIMGQVKPASGSVSSACLEKIVMPRARSCSSVSKKAS